MLGYVIAIVVIILLHHVINRYREPNNLPPGPRPFPLVGNVPQLLSFMPNVHTGLQNIAKTYGNIMTIYMNGQRTVVISSAKIGRQLLVTNKDDIAGRPYMFSADYATRGSKDIAFLDFGPTLILQRKVMHTALRLYRPKLEATVSHEVDKLISSVKSMDGKPFDPYQPLSFCILNVICDMLFGYNLDYNDPKFLEIVHFNEQIARSFGAMSILEIMPFLIHFPIQESINLKESKRNRDKFLEEELEKHKATYKEGTIRDVTDASIKALADAEQEDSKNRNLITRDHVLMALGDMFSAGNETTVTTLRWLFAYLVRNPQVQKKIREELDEVIGCDPTKRPTHEDRSSLPYLEACILETLRIASPVPLGVPHKARRDTFVQGYTIPKDTTVLINTWAMHHNQHDWQNVDVFDPSRFLVDREICPIASRNVLAFGAGRRVCLGEIDTKIELFLIAARFLQQFRLEPGDELPDMEGYLGIVNFPKPYKIRVIFRT